MASTPPEKTKEICNVENCGKKVCARGFCTACYYRKLRHGDFEPKSQTKKWKHRLSDINEDDKTAICSCCGTVKISKRTGTNNWRCSKEANERSKLYKRAYRAYKKDMLLDSCEICGKKEKLCWDHSHVTGEFRGTLCFNCNVSLGLFCDDIKILENAISYLKKNLEN